MREPETTWPDTLLSEPLVRGKVGRQPLAFVLEKAAVKSVLMADTERFALPDVYRTTSKQLFGPHNFLVLEGASDLHQAIFRAFLDTGRLNLLVDYCEQEVSSWQAPVSADEKSECPIGEDLLKIVLNCFWKFLFRVPAGSALSTEHAGSIADATRALRDVGDPRTGAAVKALVETGLSALLDQLDLDAFLGLESKACERQLFHSVLRDDLRMLVITGHETSATTVTWALWALANDPDLQERVRGEIEEAFAGGPLNARLLESLDLTKSLIMECMRLFPPAPITARQTIVPEVLCGEELPPGTAVVVCFYALHRHGPSWDEAGRFRPDRFLAKGEAALKKGAYYPFSAGPHACLGARFGWQMTLAFLAAIVSRWEILPPKDNHPPELCMGVTLRSKAPIRVRLRPLG